MSDTIKNTETKNIETIVLKNNASDIARAAELIKSGEVVGIPTETVYGLGADALSPKAVKRLIINFF